MRTTATMRALDEKRGAVRVEECYDTDIDDLWEACTRPERLARWIAELSRDLRVGGIIYATFTSTWAGPGRIKICDRPDHLLLRMEPGTLVSREFVHVERGLERAHPRVRDDADRLTSPWVGPLPCSTALMVSQR